MSKLIKIDNNRNVINLTREGDKFQIFVKETLLPYCIEKHGYGFQDGGCLMLAIAIFDLCVNIEGSDPKIFCIGRKGIEDHFVASIETKKYGRIFVDSDGFTKEDELFTKLVQTELFRTKEEDLELTFIDLDIWDIKDHEYHELSIDYLTKKLNQNLLNI